MHFKRFRGTTVAEALGQARAELGPKALVLSTRLVSVAGWRGWTGAREVEITAAAEREVSEKRPPLQAGRPSDPGAMSPVAAHLCAAGFDRRIADEIAATVARSRRRSAPGLVKQAVTAWAAPLAAPVPGAAGIDVFLGPSGAGKTTTVAKIAARARVRDGARIRLVGADAFRVGAIEQLRQYADIIGSPFTAVRTTGELADAMSRPGGPMLVDTAGRSPRDPAARELNELVGATPDVRAHLVVPAAATARQLSSLIEQHAAARPRFVVLTKIDEGEPAGALAGVLREHGLQLSYLGIGQRVPQDLLPATPAAIADALIGEPLWETGSAA